MSSQPMLLAPEPISLSAPSYASPEDIPSTTTMSRPRSNTILTTSSASSSSSPLLQTPQTPSILGVLDSYNRHRSDSYGFGEFGKALFQNGAVERRHSEGESMLAREEAGVEDMLQSDQAAQGRAEVLDPPVALFEDPTASPNRHDVPRVASSAELLSPGENVEESLDKGKQRARSRVRAKLQRSRSSLKDLLGLNSSTQSLQDPHTGAPIPTPATADIDGSKRRPRLRSLLSMSRAESRASSTTSLRTPGAPILHEPVSAAATTTRIDPLSTTPESESGTGEQGSASPVDIDPRPSALSTSVLSPGINQTETRILQDELLTGPSIIPRRTRPALVSALSSGRVLSYTPLTPPITRSATDPVLVQGTFEMTLRHDEPKRDLFTEMLPRELKVMVMKAVLDMGSAQERTARWSGEVGARKELIRLSRVSKAWQALCFDGQLWPIVDLAPFASTLHPDTLKRIIGNAGPFVRTLSLRGMDALKSSTLISTITQLTSDNGPPLANLTTLDLRGCRKLSSASLSILIASAPNLRHVNLKGVQAVSSEVIRALAEHTTSLASLDVSRCWDISLSELWVFIKTLSPEQAQSLKVLRAGGLKAYGHGASDFLPVVLDRLVNLETLDLLGTTQLHDINVIRAAGILEGQSRHANLRHLNLTGCSSLTSAIFPSIIDMFPDLTRLELASIPKMFGENGEGEKGFHDFLKSLPKLEKLDLEGTGLVGGVNDRMLAILTPAKGETNALTDLKIGHAKGVTPEGLIRFIRGCTTLRNLEADNTSATNAVMREFYRRHSHSAFISLVDCRAITPVAYSHLASSSRPRDGMTGYSTIPMGYDEGELDDRVVIKVFWSWRRVGVVKGWRDVLKDKAQEHLNDRDGGGSNGAGKNRAVAGRNGKGRGWWKNDETFDDDRAGCVVQ